MKSKIEDFDKLQPKLTKYGKTRSQIGKSSKTKGKAGERYFADTLTEISGMSFIRVPNSGAGVGSLNRERLKVLTKTQGYIQLGDIIPPDNLYNRFIFECKNYKDLNFSSLLKKEGCKIIKQWIDELAYDCESAQLYMNENNIIGLLCIKITNKGNWVILNSNYTHLQITVPVLTFIHQTSFNKWNNIFMMCEFKDFIETNKNTLFANIVPSSNFTLKK
jgi:hypothetical protein